MNYTIKWNLLKTLEQFENLIESSKKKPLMIFKYRSSSPECAQVKKSLDANWVIPESHLDVYALDVMKYKDVAEEVSEEAGVENEYPQVVIFADGVTMYDESHELINVKKIKIALKIIKRTFDWMETRAV